MDHEGFKVMAAAIILAAGQSKRMGSPKMVLPWAGGTVIGKVVRTVQEAGLSEIIVVTGGAGELVEAALDGLNVRTLRNPDFTDGAMLASFQIGLKALSLPMETALVALGDQPQIELEVVKSILGVYEKGKPALVVPSYQMHRGHPWLVSRALWPVILALHPPETLRDFLNQYAAQITYLPVESASILQDLDTPADYDHYSRF